MDVDDELDRLDYYTLLGVARDASMDAVREAFHQFARRYHPDRHIGGGARGSIGPPSSTHGARRPIAC